jgi:hypothetical protein
MQKFYFSLSFGVFKIKMQRIDDSATRSVRRYDQEYIQCQGRLTLGRLFYCPIISVLMCVYANKPPGSVCF